MTKTDLAERALLGHYYVCKQCGRGWFDSREPESMAKPWVHVFCWPCFHARPKDFGLDKDANCRATVYLEDVANNHVND